MSICPFMMPVSAMECNVAQPANRHLWVAINVRSGYSPSKVLPWSSAQPFSWTGGPSVVQAFNQAETVCSAARCWRTSTVAAAANASGASPAATPGDAKGSVGQMAAMQGFMQQMAQLQQQMQVLFQPSPSKEAVFLSLVPLTL